MGGSAHHQTRRQLIFRAIAGAIVARCGPGSVTGRGRSPRRIGLITSGSIPTMGVNAFKEAMKEAALNEGADYVLESRPADGNTERLLPLARELASLSPDLILSLTTGSTQAMRAVTSSIPIVMIAAHDPIEAGIVSDLAYPGGNVTGQSLMGGDLMPKQLQLLTEAVRVGRLGYLTPDVPSPAPGYPSVTDIFERSMRTVARNLDIEVRPFKWRQDHDLDAIVGALQTERIDALYLIESSTWFAGPRPTALERVIDLSTRRGMPSFGGARAYADAGLLMTYGDARLGPELWRTAATFVVKILRGADPGSLPIDRPTRFELVLNAKTASAVGVVFPKSLIERADAVIR